MVARSAFINAAQLHMIVTPSSGAPHHCRSLRDYYSVGKTLGRGACGRVSRCISVIDGQEYAVKEGLAHNPEDYTGRHGLLNELQIMQQLSLSP